MTVVGALVAAVLWINPFCISTKSWVWVSEPCVGCWQEQPAVEQLPTPAIKASLTSKPDGNTIELKYIDRTLKLYLVIVSESELCSQLFL